jgi:hypothetical protein
MGHQTRARRLRAEAAAQADHASEDVQWVKTKEPKVGRDSTTEQYYVYLQRSSGRKGSPTKRKRSKNFSTREEAEAYAPTFRREWEFLGKSIPKAQKKVSVPLTAFTLSGVDKQQYKKRRREDLNLSSRVQWREDMWVEKNLSERCKRSLHRAWRVREQGTKKRDRRVEKQIDYLKDAVELTQKRLDTEVKQQQTLLDAINSGKVGSLLLVEDDAPPIDTAQLSSHQVARLYQQALAVRAFLACLIVKDKALVALMRGVLQTPRKEQKASEVAAALDCIAKLRLESNKPELAASVVKSLPITADTVLSWQREYSKFGFFLEDMTGKFEREWIMNEEDLLFEFQTWLKTTKRITVQKASKYLSYTLLAKEDLKSVLETYKLKLPIVDSTAHTWMLRAGAVYKSVEKTYYTDRHNAPDVVESRNTYISNLNHLSLRMPLWFTVDVSKVSEEVAAKGYTFTQSGPEGDIEMVELHVDVLGRGKTDDSDLFVTARAAMGPDGGYRSVWFEEEAGAPCRVQHDPAVCKCALTAYHMGQDESIYKAYLSEGREWVTLGVRALRKKTDGPGEMVSAFQDEIRGFGFAMTADELKSWNADRVRRGKPVMERSPGLRFLQYGKNKDGWWDYDMFADQCADVIDAFEYLYPDRQLAQEVDHSSGHGKYKPDGLLATAMNKTYGGKQRSMRDTVVDDKCLGNAPAVVTWEENGIKHTRDMKLKPEDVQSFVFKETDPPPFYFVKAPRMDTVEAVPNKKRKTSNTVQPGTEPETKTIEGYVGKMKGKQQILWERGLWREGMTVGNADPTMCCNTVLSACRDFREEKTALQALFEDRGHILIMSPKCHPELAGLGIEYSWGKSKLEFRREINDQVPAHLHDNIERALSTDILPLARVRKFARRTRDYRHVYEESNKPSDTTDDGVVNGFEMTERMVKMRKTHRNIVDLEMKYLLQS